MIRTDFNSVDFLTNYWQQKPCLLRGLLPAFDDPIDEHDLAGLSQEEHVDSRIVSQLDTGEWHTQQGPFKDFNHVLQGKWSLLVQATDRDFPAIDALAQAFDFIPYWRSDDVMISFSVPGAGVGAHVDQYDVFLVQGKGQRRWQVGMPSSEKEVINNGLRHVPPFTAVIDCICEAGDVLYIPPNWPHKGETLVDAITYSVGYRAPDSELLFGAVLDGIMQQTIANQRYQDPSPQFATLPAQVSAEELSRLKQQMCATINSEAVTTALLAALSVQHIDTEGEAIAQETIAQSLVSGLTLNRREGLRPIYADKQSGSVFWFFINGEKMGATMSLRPNLEPLLNQPQHTMYTTTEPELDAELSQLLGELISCGFYTLD